MVETQVDFRATMDFNIRYLRRHMDRAAYKTLMKVAGYVRTTAKRSIRTAPGDGQTKTQRQRKKTRGGKQRGARNKPTFASSQPGRPPKSKKGNRLRSSIFFDWDKTTKSVVIGPIRAWSGKALYRPLTRRTIPAVLEYGGREVRRRKVQGVNMARKKKKWPTIIRIENRPFMRPARQKTVQSPVFKQEFKKLLRR